MADRVDRRAGEEQAALRRVATLVASGTSPEELFGAVAGEAGLVLGADFTVLVRYDPDDAITIVGTWTRSGAAPPTPVGGRLPAGGRNVTTLVFETGRPARIDYTGVSGTTGQVTARDWQLSPSVAAPISVEGRLWGVIVAARTRRAPLPADAEARLADFTELAATAIANALARLELRRHAEEQAALHRVATLVARAARPEEVFAAVTEEAGRLLSADATLMSRYDTDDMATVVGEWSGSGHGSPAPLGTRFGLGGRDLHTTVFRTGRPARMDDFREASGVGAGIARRSAVSAAAAVPISVEGRLWGIIGMATVSELPPDTEERLAGFTELVATAIANAEARAALTASRARIVATADAARRRIERNLHDGAQQRLVSLALELRAAQAAARAAAPADGELAARLRDAVAEVAGALEELREIARGLHPAVLAESGLRPALGALARRSPVPVDLNVRARHRLPEPVEVAAYYAVAEALTNTAKHGRATRAEVAVTAGSGVLRVRVHDDGCGGAHFADGSGLAGLRDRVEALGGRVSLQSPPGAGTTVQITVPFAEPGQEWLRAGAAGQA